MLNSPTGLPMEPPIPEGAEIKRTPYSTCIHCDWNGALVYWTLDGSEPLEAKQCPCCCTEIERVR